MTTDRRREAPVFLEGRHAIGTAFFAPCRGRGLAKRGAAFFGILAPSQNRPPGIRMQAIAAAITAIVFVV
ncbi:hypothetical protein, partial [Achromobacter ruhlandii]|uniref:hypothetical protein n=1 Tax=Achromobacter ruhlandii TaxID=72557 RepID=UPI0021F108B8